MEKEGEWDDGEVRGVKKFRTFYLAQYIINIQRSVEFINIIFAIIYKLLLKLFIVGLTKHVGILSLIAL